MESLIFFQAVPCRAAEDDPSIKQEYLQLLMYLFVFIGKWKLLAHLRTEELVHMADNRDARLWCNAQV